MTSTVPPLSGTPGQRAAVTLGIYGESLHHKGGGGHGKSVKEEAWGWGSDGLGYRLDLLRQAQRLLNDKASEMKKQHPTVWCYRNFRDESGKVNVWKRDQRARLAGLITCGAVWTCPVCAAKIAEKRRLELQLAVRTWIGQGGHVYLMTLTFPHGESDNLAELVEKQADALQRFKNSARFDRVMKKYNRIGSVRGLEITFGVNGGHPHTHDLVFADKGLEADRASLHQLRSAWMRACLKVGLLKPDGTLKPFRDFTKHAFDLSGGTRAAEYIAKYGRDERWGITSEMTRNYKKVGMQRAMWADNLHVTAFQLLEWSRNGDGPAGATFRRYAEVFRGKRALSWSPGLKKRLGVADATDEELSGDAAPLCPDEEKIGSLNLEQYRTVLTRNALGDFVRFASRYASCQSDLDDFVETLSRAPEVARGTVRTRVYNMISDHSGRSSGAFYG